MAGWPMRISPFGATGEILPAAAKQPAPAPPQPLTIEPPDWQGQLGDVMVIPAAPQAGNSADGAENPGRRLRPAGA